MMTDKDKIKVLLALKTGKKCGEKDWEGIFEGKRNSSNQLVCAEECPIFHLCGRFRQWDSADLAKLAIQDLL